MSWDKLHKQWRTCKMCAIGHRATKHVMGHGNREAKVMFLGEGPGAAEDVIGEPFVGRAGQVLREAITAAGGIPSECFFTNLLVCRPIDERGENRAPIWIEVDRCRPRLVRELELVSPQIVFFCGRVPQSYEEKITEQIAISNPVHIPHPAYVTRRGGVTGEYFKEYVRQIKVGVGDLWAK